jgi:hypothetical protein
MDSHSRRSRVASRQLPLQQGGVDGAGEGDGGSFDLVALLVAVAVGVAMPLGDPHPNAQHHVTEPPARSASVDLGEPHVLFPGPPADWRLQLLGLFLWSPADFIYVRSIFCSSA